MKRKIVLFSTSLLFLFSLVSCAPFTLHSAWKNENYQGGPFKKVIILVALQDPVIKRFVEDEFVSQLNFHSTDSVASYTKLQAYGVSDKESIASTIKELDADALLIAKLIKIDKDEIDVQEKKYIIPEWYYDWYIYYRKGFGYIKAPQYSDRNYFMYIDTGIYETKTGHLVWFAHSATLMVVCGCQEIGYYIEEIINKLSSDKLIK
jgi:hypothetical protein